MKFVEKIRGQWATLMLLLVVCGALLSGCATSSITGIGHQLQPASQIPIVSGVQQSGVFTTDNLTMRYSYLRSSATQLQINGTVTFADSLRQNFSGLDYFDLGVVFADSSGKVLAQHDLSTGGGVNFTEIGASGTTFKNTLQIPARTAMMAFRYNGQAAGDRGDPTDFFSDPIER